MPMGDEINSGQTGCAANNWGTTPVSLPAPAVAGNLLIVIWSRNSRAAAGILPIPPAGFTAGPEMPDLTAAFRGAIAWKKAAGGEQNFTPSWTDITVAGRMAVVQMDATGLDLSAAVHTQDSSFINTVSATIPSGTIGSGAEGDPPPVVPALAVAGVVLDNETTATFVNTWSNSYILRERTSTGTGGVAHVAIATKTLSVAEATDTVGTLSPAAAEGWGCLLVFNQAQTGPILDSVDGDNAVTAGQANVVALGQNLAGTTTLSITTGTRSIACNVDSVTDTQIVFDVPSSTALRTANLRFGACVFETNEGAQLVGVLQPGAANSYIDVTDISQAANTGSLFNGQTPAVEVGDQLRWTNSTALHAWVVSVGTEGFFTVNSAGSALEDSFPYYVYDATDETWGAEGTITVNQASGAPPELGSIGPQTNAEVDSGVVLSPSAVGTGPFTWSASGLPTGYTINTSTGAITAPGNTNNPGTYAAATITVTNVDGSDFEIFTWTITSSDPVLAPIGNQTTTEATSGVVLTPSATGPGTKVWGSVQLPPGYTIDSGTGVVTAAGNVNNQGAFPSSVNVTTEFGTDFEAFTWTVTSSNPTVVTPVPDQTKRQGEVVSLNIAANFAGETSFTATPVPTGITFTTDTFSGIPTTIEGVDTVVTATNTFGSVQDTFHWNIVSGAPVLVIPIPDQTLYNGVSYPGNADNFFDFATSYSSTPFPPGITMDSSGIVSGTYTGGDASGTVTVTATNTYGSVQDTFAWTGYANAPVIDQDSTLNDAVLFLTGGPTYNDGLLEYYQSNGAFSTTINDAAIEFLVARGITYGPVNDMWKRYLTGKGYSGTLSDMGLQWMRAGAPL
jgi:Putative Ig domain